MNQNILYYVLLLNAFPLSFTLESTQYCENIEFWYNNAQKRDPENQSMPAIISYNDWVHYVDSYIKMQKKIIETSNWLDFKIDMSTMHNAEFIQPYVLKYVINPKDKIFLWGDLHGDIQALTASLYKLYKEGIIKNDFTLRNPKDIFLFLGDIVDRGHHGIDIIALLCIISLKNPGHVIINRGNHEDIAMISRYGFMDELVRFYTHNKNKKKILGTCNNRIMKIFKTSKDTLDELYSKIIVFFNILPVATFVGCNNFFIQCCHGGLEPRYNPLNLLMNKNDFCFEYIPLLVLPKILDGSHSLDRVLTKNAHWMNTLKHTITPFDLGFLWNDFNVKNPHTTAYEPTRGLVLGKTFTKKIFETYCNQTVHVKGIIRAHQHNDSMPGLFDTKNSGVYTLWGDPAIVFTTIGTGIYTQAPAFLELHLDNDFDKWELTAYNYHNKNWHSRKDFFSKWKNIIE